MCFWTACITIKRLVSDPQCSLTQVGAATETESCAGRSQLRLTNNSQVLSESRETVTHAVQLQLQKLPSCV